MKEFSSGQVGGVKALNHREVSEMENVGIS